MRLENYVVDTLMSDLTGHDRRPSSFLVYLYLYRHTHGARQLTTAKSLREISEATGLSKRAVQYALTKLHTRELISVSRNGVTDIPRYTVLTPWKDSVR